MVAEPQRNQTIHAEVSNRNRTRINPKLAEELNPNPTKRNPKRSHQEEEVEFNPNPTRLNNNNNIRYNVKSLCVAQAFNFIKQNLFYHIVECEGNSGRWSIFIILLAQR